MGSVTRLVVGLGNPGPRFAGTRHNLGRMVVEELARSRGERFTVHRRTNTELAELPPLVPGSGGKTILALLRCPMNGSGTPTQALARFFSVEPRNLVAVHDELDLELGEARLDVGGGDHGHKGLRSISAALSKSGGEKKYARLRVGIGRPPGRQAPADFVLKPFNSKERAELPLAIDEAIRLLEDF